MTIVLVLSDIYHHEGQNHNNAKVDFIYSLQDTQIAKFVQNKSHNKNAYTRR